MNRPCCDSRLRRGMTAGAILMLSLALTRCADVPEEPSPTSSLEPVPPDPAILGMTCTEGTLASGAPYRVCVNRALWNGDYVVFVPGYTNPAAVPSTPTGDIGGLSAADVVTTLGYAWVSTGFRGTGLVVPETWIGQDLLAVVQRARAWLQRSGGRVYMTGGSQGGLITALAIERYPQVFTGGLAACGPIGNYRRQLRYIGDFRTVFDYYFDPVIPGWPVWTQSEPDNGAIDPAYWNATNRAAVASAIQTYPARTANVLAVTKAPIDAADPGPTTRLTFDDLLRYTFVGTRDLMQKLGGLAYGNVGRLYSGSSNDAALNAGIQRFTFTASATAVNKLETTGKLTRPLVTLHTTGDHIVPEWHAPLYRAKTSRSLRSWLLHSRLTVRRYGHCTFTADEVLGAFALLVLKATGQNLVLTPEALAEPGARAGFLRAAREFGASPVEAGR
jgi:alpha-beta hydrolase superfamily lysophospholipase